MHRLLAVMLVGALATGCATGSGSVLGRTVTVVPVAGSEAARVQGELLAVEPERIWVLGKEHVIEVPTRTIEKVRVQRHSLTKQKGWAWTLIGAAVTGGAMALACTSVNDNNGCTAGGVFAGVSLTWLLLGGLPSSLLDSSALEDIKPSHGDALSPYARFPQGPPEGVDLGQLPPAPQKKPNRP